VSALDDEALETEFGVVAGWTEEAVLALGTDHAVPAACRGSGSRGALRWLARELDLAPGTRLVDSGAGLGGPAGWLLGERGVPAVCIEPMAAASRAGRRLFGVPSAVGVSQALPLAAGSFDAAWCLGVLCTTQDKAGALAELRRVLVDGGRLGLLVFVSDGALPTPVPDGNSFPTEAELAVLLRDAGFHVEAATGADLHDSPPEWDRMADAVDAEVQRRHGDDPRWQQAQEQSARMGRLLSDGHLRPTLVSATARA